MFIILSLRSLRWCTACVAANPQECQATDNLWVCLICGSVLCGARHEDHIRGHYNSTLHAYAIEIGIICA